LSDKLDDEVLTTKEAAEFLKVKDTRTILKLIDEGKIDSKKIGRGYKILKSELIRYMKEDD